MEDPQALLPVGGVGHVEPAPGQHGADAERDVPVVLDDQHPPLPGRAGRAGRAGGPRAAMTHDATAGQKTLNVLPTPRALLTSTCPPCISVRTLTMDRPRPEPGSPAVRAFEPRTNRLNSWSASSGGIPMPESATSTRQTPCEHEALTRTTPARCENLTALPIRLSRTWISRRESPCTGGPACAETDRKSVV